MSAIKKIAGLVAGISAVGAIGVAVAQGVPPNPNITNPALGAGEQTATHTLIGETGVLPWSDVYVQQAATLVKQDEQTAVVTPAPEPVQQPVAATPAPETTTVAQSATPPAQNTQSMGAAPAQDTTPAPRHDRG